MTGYRRYGSRLQGHPTPVLPWVDVASGSLGQGLPNGVGVALAGNTSSGSPYRVWVLCGDSEMAEGSIWEALDKAWYYGLSNLIAIVDVNRLGQRGPTELQWDLPTYARRAEAFGARGMTIDGHDLEEIDEALAVAADGPALSRPSCSPAPSRGAGSPRSKNQEGWHGKALPPDMADRAIAELGGTSATFSFAGRARSSRADRTGHLEVRGNAPPCRCRAYSHGGEGRDPQGLRRGAHRARRRPPRGRGPRRRSQQLHLCRPVRQGTIPAVTSRCSSPNNNSSPRPSGSASATTSPSRRPSPRSSPAPTTSSGWPRSRRRTSASSAPTGASRSAPTGRPRWPWKIWR